MDRRVDDASPFLRIRQWRREFVTGVHISTDVFFTVRQVTREPQYIFDAYMPGFKAGDSFTLLHDYQETYTNFEEEAAQASAASERARCHPPLATPGRPQACSLA